MNDRNFKQMLENKWSQGKFVCIGLDSELSKIPECLPSAITGGYRISYFNRVIVEATKDLACAYKPNIAFYEAYGTQGIAALYRTVVDIHDIAPDVPVILDANIAGTSDTNNDYLQMAFGFLNVDAITVNPYLGAEALKPFLDLADKGIFVLCRTLNSGSNEFQNLLVTEAKEPLYRYVARRVTSEWNKNGNCSLVVGTTPKELGEIRQLIGDMPILISDIGAQNSDMEKMEKIIHASKNKERRGIIFNSSDIILTSNGPDFAEAARRETIMLNDLINRYR